MTKPTSMTIPLVDLKRQYADLRGDVFASFESILSSMQLFLGPNVQAFEREYASYLDVRDAIGVSEGTSAIYLALRACGIGPGDEVITVSHTFFASIEAITMTGAVPVFVDIDPTTFLIDVSQIEAKITPRTRALLPVHLYGRICDMDALMAVAKRYGLRVIEDTAQAHGARRAGRAAGTWGDAGTFSFYYSKNLGAYGEAGGVVSNDPDVANRVRVLRDHGSDVRYHHDELGMNGRMDELQAAVLRHKLPYLDAGNEARRRHAARYHAGLQGLVQTPDRPGDDHVFHLYVVRSAERDELREYLASRGIGTGIHYPIPCHLQPACATFGEGPGSLPVTEKVVGEILSLPMFPELRDDEIDFIIDGIHTFYSDRTGNKVVAAQ